jgi:pimeloyl-ACP methyl ester carboxylesterase
MASKIDTRAGTIRFSDQGTGTPVLLLHATLHDRRDYDPVLPGLAAAHRVIAIDWPGHGESDPLPAGVPAGAVLFADVLEDIVEGLDLPPAALIGNSVGGFAAARLAIRKPHRVTRLILANGSGFTNRTALTAALFRLLGTPAVSRQVFPRLVPGYMQPRTDSDRAIGARTAALARTREGAALAAALWRSFGDQAYDLRAQGASITAPTLLVWGTKDTVLPLREGLATQRQIPGATLVALPAGHVSFSSDPDGFLEAVLPFLQDARNTVPGE